ncbi:hypothetical protein AB0O16_05920 [Microbacterium sp. NPDC089180]|uniref:hypothetical protein n=1 Tax=unclassified Microbacterium TaxID=2609290 RepID=UPI0034176349
MSDEVPVMRTVMAVDDATFSLAPGQDVADLERRIESAVHDGGRFERFTVAGDRDVRVLFTAHTRVVLWGEETPGETATIEPVSVEWEEG